LTGIIFLSCFTKQKRREKTMVLPFRLYSLEGCPHCVQAKQFLSASNVTGDEVVAGQVGVPAVADPVIEQGLLKLTGSLNYPVLVVRLTQPTEIIVGFKPEEYKRVVEAYHRIHSSSAPSVLVDGKSVVVDRPIAPVVAPQPDAPAAAIAVVPPATA